MSQDLDHVIENELDFAALEDQLYAQVHYEFDDKGTTDPNSLHSNKDNEILHSVSAHRMVKNSSLSDQTTAGNSKNGNRYWTGNSTGSSYKPFYGRKQSGIYNANQSQVADGNATTNNNPNPIIPSSSRPKPFTPYKPLLSDAGIFPSTTCGNDNVIESTSTLKVTSKLIKNRQKNATNSKSTKRKNPFSKDFSENREENHDRHEKRVNPFNQLEQQKSNAREKYNAKKEKANRNREKVAKNNRIVKIFLNSDDEDDDVVIIPTKPPPLICIDSSEDESPTKSATGDHEFTEPRQSKQSTNKRQSSSRCPSPTCSILSADDFIVQNDRQRSNDPFSCVPDDELIEVNTTVDNILKNVNQLAATPVISDVQGTETIFVTPQRKQKKKEKSKTMTKSYEVGENSFAAVDVYESESSDMPDTVYAKGNAAKRKKGPSSDSDSSIEDLTVPKSKRLRKRKSSGSNKGSDYVISDDLSTDSSDDVDMLSDNLNSSTPYLMRGEAVGKVKKSVSRKAKKILKRKLNKSLSEKHSDEEFISKLSSIVHGESDDGDEELNESRETSNESIEARDIVQSVLQQRQKKTKKHNANEENENTNWVVKDQVGTTDDNTFISLTKFDQNNDSQIAEAIAIPSTSTSKINELSEKSAQEKSGLNVRGFTLNDRKEIGWNEEMNCFYNNSWGGETFYTHEIQGRMPKTGTCLKWAVSNKDRFLTPQRGRYNSRVRCINCHENGHRSFECPQSPIPIRCYMCGAVGHQEPRCPNTICLKCGEKTRIFSNGCQNCERETNISCFVCRSKGHKALNCPDKWRRYHTTTQSNVPLTEHETPLPIKPKYCCICASKGHIAENCRNAVKIFGSSTSSVFIKCYRESYRLPSKEDNSIYPEYTVFSGASGSDFTFNYGPEVRKKGKTFYARFRRAVNLKSKKKPKEPSTMERIQKIMDTDDVNELYGLLPPNTANENKRATKLKSKKKQKEPSKTDEIQKNLETDNANQMRIKPFQHLNEPQEIMADSGQQQMEVETNVSLNDVSSENNISEGINRNAENTGQIETALEPNVNSIISETTATLNPRDIDANESFTDKINDQKIQKNSIKAMLAESREQFDSSIISNIQSENDNNAEQSFTDENETSKNETNEIIETAHNDSGDFDTIKKLEELDKLHDNMEMLRELRNKIISSKSEPKREIYEDIQIGAALYDSDSNYSFSDYYQGDNVVKPKPTLSITLPDFIPLNSNNSEQLPLPPSPPSPPSPPRITPEESSQINCDAKIYLTKDHCKYLMTTQGSSFLQNNSTKNNVSIRMEWNSIGNVLIVTGVPNGQDKFHIDLKSFFNSIEKKLKSRSDIGIPKNRITLIAYLTETIRELEKPMDSVQDLFHRMRQYEDFNTKASNKKAERVRKKLNMILFGKCGLRDGQKHLIGLQQNLRQLSQSRNETVSINFRREIVEHVNYIFSPFQHNNYADLVQQFKDLKRSKRLPILNLDRKLLGININVKNDLNESATAIATSSTSSTTVTMADSSPMPIVSKPELSIVPYTTKSPSPVDIQINVSTHFSNASDTSYFLARIKGNEIPDDPLEKAYFWTDKCMEIIDKWRLLLPSNHPQEELFLPYMKRAENNRLNYTDYNTIYNKFSQYKAENDIAPINQTYNN